LLAPCRCHRLNDVLRDAQSGISALNTPLQQLHPPPPERWIKNVVCIVLPYLLFSLPTIISNRRSNCEPTKLKSHEINCHRQAKTIHPQLKNTLYSWERLYIKLEAQHHWILVFKAVQPF